MLRGRLLDRELDQRFVDDRQHFLSARLVTEEAAAEAGDGKTALVILPDAMKAFPEFSFFVDHGTPSCRAVELSAGSAPATT